MWAEDEGPALRPRRLVKHTRVVTKCVAYIAVLIYAQLTRNVSTPMQSETGARVAGGTDSRQSGLLVHTTIEARTHALRCGNTHVMGWINSRMSHCRNAVYAALPTDARLRGRVPAVRGWYPPVGDGPRALLFACV